MSLSDEELDRYARHLVLRQVGGPGQARIRAAKVLVIGAGGLGSPLALYLAAAGIGTLGLVDDDHVSLSNLQRQILYRSADVGRAKLDAARRVDSFAEVVQGLDAETALFEARRCLSCGNCFECDNCYGVCPDNAIIKLGAGNRYRIDTDFCKGCGLCAAECPCGAIDMVPEQT